MKKNISLFITSLALAAGLLCFSCGSKTTYTIAGAVTSPDFEGVAVYLESLDSNKVLDSTTIADGKFTFQGDIAVPRMAVLRTGKSAVNTQCSSILVLESGKIAIDLFTDSLKGTPLNDLYYDTYTANPEMLALNSKIAACVADYTNAETPEAQDSLRERFNRLSRDAQQLTIELSRNVYQQHTTNVLGAYALNMVVENDGITYDSLNVLLEKASPAIADYAPLRAARTRLFHLSNTSPGRQYVDIPGINYATKKHDKLSKLINSNEVTLIDFWASWCSPCRQEIQDNLVPLYKKYKGEGLNIIGIDVRDNMQKHEEAVKELGITYPQLIDTTRNAISTYAVQSIPQIMLIGKDGKIIARDLRGDAIEQAVVEALKK